MVWVAFFDIQIQGIDIQKEKKEDYYEKK